MKKIIVEKIITGPLEENCYLATWEGTEDGKCLIVDPGASGNRILDRIQKNGFCPEAILLTHGHFDHIMAVEWIRAKYPELPVYAHRREQEVIEDPDKSFLRRVDEKYVLKHVTYIEEGKLETGSFTMEVIHTPGHTAGGTCYFLREQNILFSGDTLFQESVGRTDFPTGSLEDMKNSVCGKLMLLPEDTAVYPGHGPETTIGHEKRFNFIVHMT